MSHPSAVGPQNASPSATDLATAWRIVEVCQIYSDGEIRNRSTPEITGYLTYTTDGGASIVLGALDRLYLDAGDFTIDEHSAVVTHDFDMALFPEWACSTFVARAQICDDTLTLRATPSVTVDGRTLLMVFTWERVAAAESRFAA